MSIFEKPRFAPAAQKPVRVAVLGSTGSVGTQTLDVCRRHADKLKVVALAAYGSVEKVAQQAREFQVGQVAFANPEVRNSARLADMPDGCSISFGREAVGELCALDDVDAVVVAVVGEAGIWATYAALKRGKKVACANKEPLVSGGDLLMPMVAPGQLLPVDSEHSAIYQCLLGESESDIYKIWLTCSGGPFYGKTRSQLAQVTCAQALAHPSWTMGDKITIDSATLMNKGLEVIEAHHLFHTAIDDIEAIIHRQSKIHSMVEYVDGQVKALLAAADMRGAIQYALSYPERWEATCRHLDWAEQQPLTFGKPDEDTFGCLRLARIAGKQGGTLPCAMNAANEVANLAFRQGRLGFLAIQDCVEQVMEATHVEPVESIQQLELVDRKARLNAEAYIKNHD